jgi:hypothetical protein
MKAYYVYDSKKALDRIVVPDVDLMVRVERKLLEEFIGVRPDFSSWRGESARGLPAESFGHIVALRDEDGDVCVTDAGLWQQRMAHFLDNR